MQELIDGTGLSNEDIKKKVDGLIHSGIDLDQIIALEAEVLAQTLEENSSRFDEKFAAANYAMLERIKAHAMENCKKIREVNKLIQHIH
jgi:hypothetical protein